MIEVLAEKLQAAGNRIQRDIAEYYELSLHVMQLTPVISDCLNQAVLVNGHEPRPGDQQPSRSTRNDTTRRIHSKEWSCTTPDYGL